MGALKMMVAPDVDARCRELATIPLLRDAHGRLLKRNFVHLDDLAEAILLALDNPITKAKLYNICMDEPVDYGTVAAHLKRTQGLDSIDVPSQFHSNWMDNSKARFEMGWRPAYDTGKLIDAAWAYRRPPGELRKIWYPG